MSRGTVKLPEFCSTKLFLVSEIYSAFYHRNSLNDILK